MAEAEKAKRSFSGEIPTVFHPSISLWSFDFPPNAPRHSSSKNHVPSASSFPAYIFFLYLVFFVTIVSIFMWTVTISFYEYRERSVLASLFGADSSSILPSHPLVGRMNKKEEEFWKQEAGEAYKPCLDFSLDYRKRSAKVSIEKRRFLVVSVSGDFYQLQNQIIDAVIIARILGAALVVSPSLKLESGVPTESGLSDIFDVEHFARTLRSDVRVVESHPYVHLSSNQAKVFELPRYVTPEWIRAKFSKQLNDEGVLLLTGIESKLVKRIPINLQKLRCKVAFHALRFADPIREIGYRLAKRNWIEGPYAAFHLGLKDDADHSKGSGHEELVLEIAKNLKGLGVPKNAMLYAAGAKQFGSEETLKPLLAEFPNMVTMNTLAKAGELSPFANSSFALAAIDHTVALNSDVFLVPQSDDSHLSRALKGQRAYAGQRKVLDLHLAELRTVSDVDAYADFECMCRRGFNLF